MWHAFALEIFLSLLSTCSPHFEVEVLIGCHTSGYPPSKWEFFSLPCERRLSSWDTRDERKKRGYLGSLGILCNWLLISPWHCSRGLSIEPCSVNYFWKNLAHFWDGICVVLAQNSLGIKYTHKVIHVSTQVYMHMYAYIPTYYIHTYICILFFTLLPKPLYLEHVQRNMYA